MIPFRLPLSKCRPSFSLLLYHHAQSPQKYVRIISFFLPLITHLQNSFDALELYIQSQKALLARTQSDADRLRLLREQAASDPENFFDSFDEKVILIIFGILCSFTRTIAQR